MDTPLIVTARLDTPTVGLIERAVMLDGPLSWAAAMDAHAAGVNVEPLTRLHAPDMDLPLARWDEAGTWGWCTSAAILDIASYTATELRRKPATGPMARFTTDRAHHTGLGPYKARDTTVAAALINTARWHVLATDSDRLEALLALITHLGKHANIGYGHVAKWVVEPDPNRDAWRDRPMPAPGTNASHRAPYHHPTRRVTVTQ
jgi:CRISPR type IV-associated protein Csf3